MLGDNIRKVRKEKGISINKLSKLSGVSLGYLSDLENNNAKNPTMDKLQSIADVLGIPVNELLSTEEKLDFALGTIDKISEIVKDGLSEYDIDIENGMYSIMAKFDKEKFTKDEQKEIINFIEFIISKRNNK